MAIKDLQVLSGAQVQAAGILFFCKKTYRMLVILRSPDVIDPNTWCSAGGKIEFGETPDQAARREVSEELGFDGQMELVTAYVYESDDLQFHNFIGIVDEEFQPQLNWESSGYAWVSPKMVPQPIHYGLKALLSDEFTSTTFKRFLGT